MLSFIKENAFVILGCLSAGFLLIFGLVRIIQGARGTWSNKIKVSDPAPSANGARKTGFESNGERRARAFLESYFNVPFGKSRPDFLSNDVTGGSNMEIDCFNKDLMLGVEYNGRQHYEYTPFFHTSREAFYNQKYRDKLKRIYCSDRGVTLIEIPYTVSNNLEAWLEAELIKRGYGPK